MKKPKIIIRGTDNSEHTLDIPVVPRKGEQIAHNGNIYVVSTVRHMNESNMILLFVHKIEMA